MIPAEWMSSLDAKTVADRQHPEAARDRLRAGSATDTDVFASVMSPVPLPASVDPVEFLLRAGTAAWAKGPEPFAAWLTHRAVLAAMSVGTHGAAAAMLATAGTRGDSPACELLRLLVEFERSPGLSTSCHGRRATWGLYAQMNTPSVPSLPEPPDDSQLSIDEFRARVQSSTSEPVVRLIHRGSGLWDAHLVEALVKPLRDRVASVLQSISGRTDLLERTLMPAVSDCVPCPNALRLVPFVEHLFKDAPRERLIACLVLRQSLSDSSAAADVRASLAWVAADAILETRETDLFRARESLLAEAAKALLDPAQRTRAILLWVNMRNALHRANPQVNEENLAALLAALRVADRLEDVVLLIDIARLSGSTLAFGPQSPVPGALELRAEVLRVLSRVRDLEMAPVTRGEAAAAESIVLSSIVPETPDTLARRLRLLTEALSALPPWSDVWITAACDRVRVLAVLGDDAQAISIAKQLLDDTPQEVPDAARGHLLANIGAVLLWANAPDDARTALTEAVRYIGDGPDHADALLHLAEATYASGRVSASHDLLDRILAVVDQLSQVERVHFHRLCAAVAADTGDASGADLSRHHAAQHALGTPLQPVTQLDLALAHGDKSGVQRVLREYEDGRWPVTADMDLAVERAIRASTDCIPAEDRDRWITWAVQSRRPEIAALLSLAGGDHTNARTHIRAWIVRARDPVEQLNAHHALLRVLDPTDQTARRETVLAIEAASDGASPLGPAADVDTGIACTLAANGDPAWLRRAQAHFIRALDTAQGLPWEERAALHCLQVTTELVRLALPQSSTRVATDAMVAVAAAVRGGPPQVGTVAALVELLLHPGLLTHPNVLDAADRLIRASSPHASLDALAKRLASIRAVHGPAGGTPAGARKGLAGEPAYDRVPQWIVGAIADHQRALDPAKVVREISHVPLACRVRPDAADALIARIVGVLTRLHASAREKILATLRQAIAPGPHGEPSWPQTVQVLGSAGTAGLAGVDALRGTIRGILGAEPADASRSGATRVERAATAEGEENLQSGIATMHAARMSTGHKQAQLQREAIRLLQKALQGCKWSSIEPDALVSLGNALRMPPGHDFDGAIAAYQKCAALDPAGAELIGRLNKVWAEALLGRGAPDDLREGWRHVELSLQHRPSGQFRSATLCTGAHIARQHPDWTPLQRARQVTTMLAESIALDPASLAEFLPGMLEFLGAWSRLEPQAVARDQIVAAFVRQFPQERATVQRAAEGHRVFALVPPEEDGNQVDAFAALTDPNFAFVVQAATLVSSPSETLAQVERHTMALQIPERIRQSVGVKGGLFPSMFEDPEGLKRTLRELQKGTADTTSGRAVASAILTTRLVVLGAAPLSSFHGSIRDARTRVTESTSAPALRAALLEQLATMCGQLEDFGLISGGFAMGVDLARQAVELCGGATRAPRDILATLGRTLRYSNAGDHRQNLREARDLYERVLVLDRAAGWAPGIANMLNLLGDLEAEGGDGDQRARLLRSIQYHREALRIAVDPPARAEFAGNLAWALTTLADRSPRDATDEVFREASDHFELALQLCVDPRKRANIARNEVVFKSMRLRHDRDLVGEVSLWRTALAKNLEVGSPLDVAIVQHNLAQALAHLPTASNLAEAVELLRSALRHRTLEEHPRFHWESQIELGRALTRWLAGPAARPDGLESAAEDALLAAASAARRLGRGDELEQVGLDQLELALQIADADSADRIGDAGWRACAEAAPSLLLTPESSEQVAARTVALAFHLYGLVDSMKVVTLRVGPRAVRGPEADRIARWLMRSDQRTALVVESRLTRPAGVGTSAWLKWQDSLANANDPALRKHLESFHESDPQWLAGEPSLARTREWLGGAAGAVAVGAWPGNGGTLFAMIGPRSLGIAVFAVPGRDLPTEVQAASELRRHRGTFLSTFVQAARAAITQPLQALLGALPPKILWCPHGALRLAPPAALFPGSVVTVTPSLCLREHHESRKRPDTGTVILADPGDEHSALGPDALAVATDLTTRFGSGARFIASVGARYGAALDPRAIDSPASAAQVMREFDHGGMIVFLGHGHTDTSKEARLDCLTREGALDPLDTRALQRDPGALANATVLLLSCEAGRVGDIPGALGGIPGALLACGAREVIAPLWPVSLDAATEVARRLVDAWTHGADLAQVLASPASIPTSSPDLGRPPSPQAQRAEARWDGMAFVSWRA